MGDFFRGVFLARHELNLRLRRRRRRLVGYVSRRLPIQPLSFFNRARRVSFRPRRMFVRARGRPRRDGRRVRVHRLAWFQPRADLAVEPRREFRFDRDRSGWTRFRLGLKPTRARSVSPEFKLITRRRLFPELRREVSARQRRRIRQFFQRQIFGRRLTGRYGVWYRRRHRRFVPYRAPVLGGRPRKRWFHHRRSAELAFLRRRWLDRRRRRLGLPVKKRRLWRRERKLRRWLRWRERLLTWVDHLNREQDGTRRERRMGRARRWRERGLTPVRPVVDPSCSRRARRRARALRWQLRQRLSQPEVRQVKVRRRLVRKQRRIRQVKVRRRLVRKQRRIRQVKVRRRPRVVSRWLNPFEPFPLQRFDRVNSKWVLRRRGRWFRHRRKWVRYRWYRRRLRHRRRRRRARRRWRSGRSRRARREPRIALGRRSRSPRRRLFDLRRRLRQVWQRDRSPAIRTLLVKVQTLLGRSRPIDYKELKLIHFGPGPRPRRAVVRPRPRRRRPQWVTVLRKLGLRRRFRRPRRRARRRWHSPYPGVRRGRNLARRASRRFRQVRLRASFLGRSAVYLRRRRKRVARRIRRRRYWFTRRRRRTRAFDLRRRKRRRRFRRRLRIYRLRLGRTFGGRYRQVYRPRRDKPRWIGRRRLIRPPRQVARFFNLLTRNPYRRRRNFQTRALFFLKERHLSLDQVLTRAVSSVVGRDRRRGAVVMKVPQVVSVRKSYTLARHWLKKAVLARGERRLEERLLQELIHPRGAIKFRDAQFRTSMANVAYL